MNIAIISPEYPPYTNWGGVATFNHNLAQALSRLGHVVHIITYDGQGDREREERDGNIVIHYIPYKTTSRVFNVFYYKLFWGVIRRVLRQHVPRFVSCVDWNVYSLLFFVRQQKKTQFHLLHCPTYGVPSLFISLLYRKIPTILYAQGPQEFFNKYESPSLDNKLNSVVENWYILHCARTVVACSIYMQRLLQKKFSVLRDKIVYLLNFIDPEQYHAVSHLDKHNIVFWGRLEYRKGIDILIRAFVSLAKKDPAMRLYLIGDSSGTIKYSNTSMTIDRYFRSLNIPSSVFSQIIMYPRIDDKRAFIDLLNHIKGIAVFPSRMEPFGFVVVEAMALGYVTIASNHGGGKEIITQGVNGFLTKPTYESTLKKCVALEKTQVQSITKSAQKTVKSKYSVTNAMKQLSTLEKLASSL
jgi:glycogen synthase